MRTEKAISSQNVIALVDSDISVSLDGFSKIMEGPRAISRCVRWNQHRNRRHVVPTTVRAFSELQLALPFGDNIRDRTVGVWTPAAPQAVETPTVRPDSDPELGMCSGQSDGTDKGVGTRRGRGKRRTPKHPPKSGGNATAEPAAIFHAGNDAYGSVVVPFPVAEKPW
jgi:hypothetical protein